MVYIENHPLLKGRKISNQNLQYRTLSDSWNKFATRPRIEIKMSVLVDLIDCQRFPDI